MEDNRAKMTNLTTITPPLRFYLKTFNLWHKQKKAFELLRVKNFSTNTGVLEPV